MRKPNLQVNLKTYQRKWRIDSGSIRKFLQKIWAKLSAARKALPEAELTVVFLNNQQMQSYNKQYRSKDYPTDVLSFPVNQTVDGKYYLGDMLICIPKANSQATEKGHSLKRELEILLLHGVLHLLGYDHETDSGQMERLERQLRKALI